MTSRLFLTTSRWLIRDTLRQALASGVFWFTIAASIGAALFCLTARVSADGQDGLQMAFGSIVYSADEGIPTAVRSFEGHMASWVANVAGLALALMWTAGFLPGFLEPASMSVLIAKPAPRWLLLTGKVIGVLVLVALQAVLFIGGTWLALGVRTGVWDPTYLLCVFLLVLHFAVFFSFSTMLAVTTRSAVASVFGSLLFWTLCWAMNFGRHAVLVIPEMHGLSGALAATTEVGYWILPKPLDFQLLLSNGLHPGDVVARLVSAPRLAEQGAWYPILSILASTSAALVLFGIATYDFATADY